MAQVHIDEAIANVSLMTDAELNKFVDFIREEMKDRSRRRNRLARAQIEVGDKVVIAGKMKPAYLTGLHGKVIEFKQTRVTIRLDIGPYKKFRSGTVTLPPSALEKVTE